MGIMSYLSSPLWLLLLIVSALEMFLPSGIAPFTYFGRLPELPLLVSQAVPLLQLATATLVLLYAPKLLALVVLLAPAAAVQGAWRRRRVCCDRCCWKACSPPCSRRS